MRGDAVVLGLNPGHDGAFAAVKDRSLLFALESEKDSYPRYSFANTTTLLKAIELLDEIPDVIAECGAEKGEELGAPSVGAGYFGLEKKQRPMSMLGKQGMLFSTTHERAHILSSLGMAPEESSGRCAALVWEGGIGAFYLIEDWRIVDRFPVLYGPGTRYVALFGLADPNFPDKGGLPRHVDAGRLMALAAYGNVDEATPTIHKIVDQLIHSETPWPFEKHALRDTPIYNAGVEAEVTKVTAAVLTERIFHVFAEAARTHLPSGLPLYISGGCGLNCGWNIAWRELGHFSSVFVPPCPNDSGLAIGAVADALLALTGSPMLDWSVYGGLEFEWDCSPLPEIWQRRDLDLDELAAAIARGRVVAWVQGRAEIGPRALGNRSLLAEPFDLDTRARLTEIKIREGYRPIAPVCRVEDVAKVFDREFEDPYMLYFRKAITDDLAAVTHVDGTARCQTVSIETNEALHALLTAFAEQRGVGVLCNTSLNFKGRGFINRMSDLTKYCETRGVTDFVVGDQWFSTTSYHLDFLNDSLRLGPKRIPGTREGNDQAAGRATTARADGVGGRLDLACDG